MATARLKKVDEFLTCTICTDMYTDPCTLYCQHTFCRKCITKYTKTRPEALLSKTIPCPSCRQVSKVPHPTRPVEEWAWQIKPSIVILGLIDTSQPDPTTAGGSDTDRCCSVCEHLGETTPAIFWCPECEAALCDRCTKTHRANPASRDHDICDLSDEVKVRRRRRVMCSEHKKNCIEFHCKDCKISACQKCCIIYHRACKSVLDIESMKQTMAKDLLKKRAVMSKHLESKSTKVKQKKVDVDRASQNKLAIQSQIRSVSQKAIDKIKHKEKQLMDKLDEFTEKQMSQLQADVKSEEIDIQMYRQHCEFIDQAVNSESVMDMYDMYQACESGVLVLGDIRSPSRDTADSRQMKDVRFTPDSYKALGSLDDLQLGKIDVTYEERSSALTSPVLCYTIDGITENDNNNPCLTDGTVLVVDGVKTVVVTDDVNHSLKSFYTRSNMSCHSTIPFNTSPSTVTQLNENQVMVTLPDSNQLVRVKVTPDLVSLLTIKTRVKYYALAVIGPSFLAAGRLFPDYVDILNMGGHVMKSVSTHINVGPCDTIWSMCVNNKGNVIVSNHSGEMLTCLTSNGNVLWQQTVGYCNEITTNGNDDILVVLRASQMVIQLTETGQFVRDVLTSADGLCNPRGVWMDKSGSLFLCDGGQVKVFEFV